MEADGARNIRQAASEPIKLMEACEKYLTEARLQNHAESTVYKYALQFRRMQAFAQNRGLQFLCQFDVVALSEFRAQWHEGPRTRSKNLERLRAFFRFAQRRKWITDNPALELRAPHVDLRPTLPFTQAEWERTLNAFSQYEKRAGISNSERLLAFVLLLRYSGMRIGDAVRCRADWFDGAELSYYTQKTKQQVIVSLPNEVMSVFKVLPQQGDGYYFWSGKSKLHSAVGKWQRRLQNLFRIAGVSGGHAHRFRDTYAHDLAHNGRMTLQELAHALGHKSIRVTEKYYSPWIAERQERLEQKMKLAWSNDPSLKGLWHVSGTRNLHGS